jgi:hypothetical protein
VIRYIEGFSYFVTSITAPIASGWSLFAGWGSHPLENAAFARRTPIAGIWAHLVRRSKFSPGSCMTACLLFTDIQISKFSKNPILATREESRLGPACRYTLSLDRRKVISMNWCPDTCHCRRTARSVVRAFATHCCGSRKLLHIAAKSKERSFEGQLSHQPDQSALTLCSQLY